MKEQKTEVFYDLTRRLEQSAASRLRETLIDELLAQERENRDRQRGMSSAARRKFEDACETTIANLLWVGHHPSKEAIFYKRGASDEWGISWLGTAPFSHRQLRDVVDLLGQLGYTDNTTGEWAGHYEQGKASTIRPTDRLLHRLDAAEISIEDVRTEHRARPLAFIKFGRQVRALRETDSNVALLAPLRAYNAFLRQAFIELPKQKSGAHELVRSCEAGLYRRFYDGKLHSWKAIRWHMAGASRGKPYRNTH